MAEQVAVFAGGCFWCTEAVFNDVVGVKKVESGYTGGSVPSPSYKQVCGGDTGHAEAIRITFDPDVLSYADLLDIFFATHDPTQLNRQGNDVGTQYRSAIFYHSEEQKRVAEDVVKRLGAEKLWKDPIVTEIVPASEFYVAEDYHQEYFERVGGSNPYCSFVIEPKVAKFRKKYFDRLKK
jgi:peptide-methionine (S)-S-oxide reductase